MDIQKAPERHKTLDEPIQIAKFWKSPRNKSQHVRLDVSTYKGHTLLNIRIWSTGPDGIDRPTPKGIALAVRRLPELLAAVKKAHATAVDLGLLEDDGGEE
jgi:hypothetical protein